MLRQRHARVAIVLADKAAFVAQSQSHAQRGSPMTDALQQTAIRRDRSIGPVSGFRPMARPSALDAGS